MIETTISTLTRSFDQTKHGLVLPLERKPQKKGERALPSETTIVSTDNHWSPGEDIFYKSFPRHLRDQAPRILQDDTGRFHWWINDKLVLPPHIETANSSFEMLPGSSDLKSRMRDLAAEGIDKEIVFGNVIGAFYGYKDLVIREHIFNAYNEHLAQIGRLSNGVFNGVGLINYWDMKQVRASVQNLKTLGLKAFLLPQTPKGADGAILDYCVPEMDALWDAAEEAKLPVCFHIGEFSKDGSGGIGAKLMVDLGPFRKTLGELIFGAIFDRHPGLKIVFVEADMNWVPGALQSATTIYECFIKLIEPKIKRHPREYWSENCFVTFMHDPAGMMLLDIIGHDRVMWSADYPHIEGTFGTSWDAIDTVLSSVDAVQARAMLGGTALKVFDLA